MHTLQGRTVDNVIAAMEARHPHLTTQKSSYVEISRARDRTELVTDDVAELRAQLQAATGERIAALEGIGGTEQERPDREKEGARTAGDQAESVASTGEDKARDRAATSSREHDMPAPDRGRSAGIELER